MRSFTKKHMANHKSVKNRRAAIVAAAVDVAAEGVAEDAVAVAEAATVSHANSTRLHRIPRMKAEVKHSPKAKVLSPRRKLLVVPPLRGNNSALMESRVNGAAVDAVVVDAIAVTAPIVRRWKRAQWSLIIPDRKKARATIHRRVSKLHVSSPIRRISNRHRHTRLLPLSSSHQSAVRPCASLLPW